ncbi:M24 family metallopeptidase [Sporosarcina sp. FA9]|uniref:M24 family metallopeptidase n=1 Tax=Sporosarcina sp. FA9 TaxID=3413030 RepID=UPI003F655D7A
MNTVYETRRKKLENYLGEQQIELAMITAPSNVFYYTGFNSDPHERFMALVFDMRKGEITLFVPLLDESSAALASDIQKIIPISDAEEPFEVVSNTLGADIATFGVEMKALSLFRYNGLKSFYPKATVSNIEDAVNAQRIKKSAHEIKAAQKAIDIIEKVLAEGIKTVKIGMSENELTAELEFLMRKFGADGPSFSTIVLSGEKSALPHGSPGERAFEKGDFLLIDMGVIKDGYCSDITRTFVIGEATEEQKAIYQIVLESNKAGINAVKAGVELKSIDIAARNVISEKGYGDYFNNRVGHGLGIEVHEEPSVHEGNTAIAEKGLLFTIEPGIYLPELGGVRIEDIVYINDDGEAQVLTSYPKELQVL